MASELKFKSWEELIEFLEKVPVDIRLRYLTLLLDRRLEKSIRERLEAMKTKAQSEFDSLKLWKRTSSMQSSQVREVTEERKEATKKTALESTVAASDTGVKRIGIVEYAAPGVTGTTGKIEYGVKKFEENKEGIKYNQPVSTEYAAKVDTEYTSRVSQGGTGSFKTSEDIIKESEKYKIKYKTR